MAQGSSHPLFKTFYAAFGAPWREDLRLDLEWDVPQPEGLLSAGMETDALGTVRLLLAFAPADGEPCRLWVDHDAVEGRPALYAQTPLCPLPHTPAPDWATLAALIAHHGVAAGPLQPMLRVMHCVGARAAPALPVLRRRAAA